jgi:hypothetical protein
LKDPSISSDAKALRALIGAYADGPLGATYVQPETLGRVLGWGRDRRETAQKELARTGWLRLKWKRGLKGRFNRRVYVLAEPPTVAGFHRSGQNPQLTKYHDLPEPALAGLSRQVKSPGTTNYDCKTQTERLFGKDDLT